MHEVDVGMLILVVVKTKTKISLSLESPKELLLAAFTAARVFFNISENVSPHGYAGWV